MAMMQAPDSGIRDMGACGASWVLGVDSPECGIDSGCSLGLVQEKSFSASRSMGSGIMGRLSSLASMMGN